MIEELADGLYGLADVAAELGGGVAQDVDARGRETGLDQIASEAVIEGSAGDAVGTSARLPEGLGGLHGREVLADIGERPNDGGQCRTRQFPAAAHAALADVAVENGGIVEGDIAGGQIDHLRPASAG